MSLTHYMLATPEPRPFLTRALCDLSDAHPGTHESPRRMTGEWADVTCPGCDAIGPDGAETVLALPDAVLVSLGAREWVSP